MVWRSLFENHVDFVPPVESEGLQLIGEPLVPGSQHEKLYEVVHPLEVEVVVAALYDHLNPLEYRFVLRLIFHNPNLIVFDDCGRVGEYLPDGRLDQLYLRYRNPNGHGPRLLAVLLLPSGVLSGASPVRVAPLACFDVFHLMAFFSFEILII